MLLAVTTTMFGRFNYDYANKYLFEASVRRDGYDNFGTNNRFGVFPSLSLGWNIAKEDFMADNKIFSNLKLRGSWGQIGNNTIDQFLYETAWNPCRSAAIRVQQFVEWSFIKLFVLQQE